MTDVLWGAAAVLGTGALGLLIYGLARFVEWMNAADDSAGGE